MCETQQGPPIEEKNPRIRTIVNGCWNCDNLRRTTDDEHEDGGGNPYCIMDGAHVQYFNICKDWEEQEK